MGLFASLRNIASSVRDSFSPHTVREQASDFSREEISPSKVSRLKSWGSKLGLDRLGQTRDTAIEADEPTITLSKGLEKRIESSKTKWLFGEPKAKRYVVEVKFFDENTGREEYRNIVMSSKEYNKNKHNLDDYLQERLEKKKDYKPKKGTAQNSQVTAY